MMDSDESSVGSSEESDDQNPENVEIDAAEEPEAAEEGNVPKEKKEYRKMENYLLEREYARNTSVVKTLNANFEKDFFCQKDIREHTGCINAVEFSHKENFLATGGDDAHSRIWAVDELMLRKNPKPISICEKGHNSNIFCLEFDLEDRFVYSGERFGSIFKHDISTNRHVLTARCPIPQGDAYSLDHHPFDTHQVAVTHCKQISILDDRDHMNLIRIRGSIDDGGGDFYSAEFHPVSPVLLLITSDTAGPSVFDRRNLDRPLYSSERFQGFIPNRRENTGYMGGTWSPSGNQYMAIRRRLCPIYFDVVSQRCFQLDTDMRHLEYRNGKTVKSMTFIDDYTVCTGSDNWGIHFWKAPRADDTGGFVEYHREADGLRELIIEKEIRVLRGHRSIPNQIRYSNHNRLLVSSGVENSFKLWSNCRLPWSYDVPFVRRKREDYDHSLEIELQIEKDERQALEALWNEQGLMEARATYEDVFGGDEDTAEDRETLEMFDVLHQEVESDSSDSEDLLDGEEEEEVNDEEDVDPWIGINNRNNAQWAFLILQRQGEQVLVRQIGEDQHELDEQRMERDERREEIRERRARRVYHAHRDWFDASSDEEDDDQNVALRRWHHMFVERESSDDEEEEDDDEEREGVEPVSEEEAEEDVEDEEGSEDSVDGEGQEEQEEENMEVEDESEGDSEGEVAFGFPLNDDEDGDNEDDAEED